MKSLKTKVLACTLAAALAFGSAPAVFAAKSPTTSVTPVKQENVSTSAGKVDVKVDTKSNGTASISQVEKTSAKTVTVSSTVKVDGVKYTVTTIDANAFAKATKATKVELPKTITKVKKNAFKGAKKLKTISFSNTKAAKVEKGAFKGLNTKKMTIKLNKNMPKKQRKQMEKNLKKAGFKGKIK